MSSSKKETKKNIQKLKSTILVLADKSSKLNHVKAKVKLAGEYFHGINGKRKDIQRAFDYYHECALNGSVPAQYMVAGLIREFIFENDGKKFKISTKGQDPKTLYFKYLKMAAECIDAHPFAQFHLGVDLLKGNYGIEKDDKLAFEYFTKSSKYHNQSMFYVGFCSEFGFGTTLDLKKAFIAYKLAAKDGDEKGSREAMDRLGRFYEEGIGGARVHKEEAFRFYKRAAELGVKHARRNVAKCILLGVGTPENVLDALKLYDELAEEGDTLAATYLAYIYYHGEFVPKDLQLSFKYHFMAAIHGDKDSFYQVARCYMEGIGIDKNLREGHVYLSLSVDKGVKDAKIPLAAAYFHQVFAAVGIQSDDKRMVEILREFPDNPRAMHLLGLCYMWGRGVKKEPHKAFELIKKASELGEKDALVDLGICYLDGVGVEKNATKACTLFEEDLKEKKELNSPNASNYLALCLLEGNGVPQDRKRAFELLKQVEPLQSRITYKYLSHCYGEGFGTEKDLKKSIEYLKLSAEKEDIEAYGLLGEYYLKGFLVEKNENDGVEYLKKFTKEGHPRAMNAFAICQLKGLGGLESNPKKAFKKFVQASKEDVDALNNVGWCYLNGIGVKKDIEKAIEHFKMASDKQHRGAQYNLSWCSLMGLGMPLNMKKAKDELIKLETMRFQASLNGDLLNQESYGFGLAWYGYSPDKMNKDLLSSLIDDSIEKETKEKETIIDLADETPQVPTVKLSSAAFWHYALANCFYYGFSFPQSFKESFHHFEEAAKLGHYDAKLKLANCYRKGLGVEKNMDKALEIYNQLWQEHSDDMRAYTETAISVLQNENPSPSDYQQAFKIFRTSSRMGHPFGYAMLGWCYERGHGVEANLEIAVENYKKAAEKNAPLGHRYLGWCFDEGIGVPKDTTKAFEHYKKAAELDDVDGLYNTAIFYEYGLLGEKDMEKAYNLYAKAAILGQGDAKERLKAFRTSL